MNDPGELMIVGHWEMEPEIEREKPKGEPHLWFLMVLTAAGWGAFFILGYTIVMAFKAMLWLLGVL